MSGQMGIMAVYETVTAVTVSAYRTTYMCKRCGIVIMELARKYAPVDPPVHWPCFDDLWVVVLRDFGQVS